MKRLAPALIAVLALSLVGSVSLTPRVAHADDEVITACDGGSTSCVLDMGLRLDWTVTVRCENDPARYKACVSSTCAPGSTELKLDADRTFDLPMNKTAGARGTPKRYMGFALDDGGIPNCKIYKQPN